MASRSKKKRKSSKPKLPKAKLPAGVTEDEFGELRQKLKPKRLPKLSKALLRQAEYDIYTRMSQKAKEELYAQEDARIFAVLDAAFMSDDERALLESLKTKLKAAAADMMHQFEKRIDMEVELLLTAFWAKRKTPGRGKKAGV